MTDFFDALHAVRRRWVTVAVLTLLGLAVGAAALLVQPVRFASTASIYISATGATNLSDVSSGNQTSQQIVASLAQVATTPLILDKVREDLKIDESADQLASEVTVEVPQNTVVMNITVTDESPTIAARVANTVAAELGQQLSDLNPNVGNAASVLRTYGLRTAEPGSAPVSPKVLDTLSIGVLGGFAAGVVLVLTARLLTRRVLSADELSEAVGVPVVGVVPEITRNAGGSVALAAGEEPFGERIRELRANVRFLARRGGGQVMLVTSPNPDDGKSTVAVNLGYALAIAGQRTLLIDADLRRPSLHHFWGLDNTTGLSSLLIGEMALADALTRVGTEGLDLLTAGTTPPNPGELCASPAMRDLLQKARAEYDAVVIDTPPVQRVADALDLGSEADGVLVVARSGSTLIRDAEATVAKLRNNGALVFGFVVSRVDARDAGPYGYYTNPEPEPAGRLRTLIPNAD
jgi:capsular exopolysaccharide synthesis family protein